MLNVVLVLALYLNTLKRSKRSNAQAHTLKYSWTGEGTSQFNSEGKMNVKDKSKSKYSKGINYESFKHFLMTPKKLLPATLVQHWTQQAHMRAFLQQAHRPQAVYIWTRK